MAEWDSSWGPATAHITLTREQVILLLLGLGGLGVLIFSGQGPAVVALRVTQTLFLCNAFWRFWLLYVTRHPPPSPPLTVQDWPRYTIVAALYHEAPVLGRLVERLAAIDYPADRLQGFLALEADDHESQAAAAQLDLPSWLTVLIVPPGSPRTKPRALNYALAQATGDLLTIYDAEDDPDPLQLREAAVRFDAEGPRLACLQAPLRIRRWAKSSASPLLDRQFAAEYAALFEIVLPAMAQMGLPFPLGGTSNHFRVPILRELNGWDAWNVTEDADLGFRLWRAGYSQGVLRRPTYETPPGDISLWLPQRTRWLKGYLQTLAVHARLRSKMGWRGWWALSATIGVGLGSAAVHAACAAWILALTLTALMSGRTPAFSTMGWLVLILGVGSAWLIKIRGARLAGTPYGPVEMLVSLAYWCLLSLAFTHAVIRLAFEPHRWDKTPHRLDVRTEPDAMEALCDNAGRAPA